MAVFPLGQNKMDSVGDLGCDKTEDITTNLPAYIRSNNLKPGTTCLCKQTSVVYMMGSDGSIDPI